MDEKWNELYCSAKKVLNPRRYQKSLKQVVLPLLSSPHQAKFMLESA